MLGNQRPSSLSVVLAALGTLAPLAHADILPAGRRTTWNPGIPGGIPVRATVCATLAASTYGNGTQDATAAIQAAIDACPVGQVVQLSAGDFLVNGWPVVTIDKGVVLRGAGAGATRLRKTAAIERPMVVIGQLWPEYAASVDLAANAAKGATSVQVTSAAGFSAGQLVLLDELTDDSYVYWGIDPAAAPGGPARGWFTRYDRPVGQMLEIASISGNTVSFTTPLHIAFDTAHRAQLTRYKLPYGARSAGLEDLTVLGGMGGGNILVRLAMYSWVKGVDSDRSLGDSVTLDSSFRCVLRDSYVHDAVDPNPGGNGYLLSVGEYTSDSLVENNIFINANKVMVMRASGGGNVIGYNYFDNGYIESYPGWVETGLNPAHMTCPHFELFEGNQAFNADPDDTWGGAVYNTFFRNHLTGKRRSFDDIDNRRAAGLTWGHYYYSFVGNVLGTADQDPAPYSGFAYEDLYPWEDDPIGMWRIGYTANDWNAPAEARVVNTVHRHGNFDFATGTVRWANGYEQALPDSLYLTGKPAFFGSSPWPWVDPIGEARTHTLPARARYDAGTPVPPLAFYTLNVGKAGSGTGTVSSSPPGIDCGADCSESYIAGAVVTLTATAHADSTFTGWSGPCSGTGSCQVTMATTQSVAAAFALTSTGSTLSVTKAGAGSGTVTSSPPGIDCGADCSQFYVGGTTVALTAVAAAGSVFSGWSGPCSGTGACQVTVVAARPESVIATFVPATVDYPLEVAKTGNGSGAVTSSPPGIDCGSDCSESYPAGTVVTLTASPAAGSVFSGWKNGPCSGTGTCQVTMTSAVSVTASFTSNPVTYTLTVTRAGTGTGTVTSSPPGIDCGADCSEPYLSGTTVTLTAAPAADSTFSGWSGACSGTGSCHVTMSAATAVTATFAVKTTSYTLTVTRAGTGAGTVTSSPAGISCGADCSEAYASGTVVTLEAVPAAGSTFSGWSDACSGTGSCQVAMTAARSVTATFTLTPLYHTLTVTRSGDGEGAVTSSPAGVDCGADCSEGFPADTVVQLTATPGAGSVFVGWGGACTGAGSCQVTMSAARAVTAGFGLAMYTLTVTSTGPGSGSVTSSPAGIGCGPDCSEAFNRGTVVSLTPTAAPGSTFGGWSDACTGTGSCQVTMDGPKRAVASFLDAGASPPSGDFDRDGRPDVLWRNKVTGSLYVWFMVNGSMTSGSSLLPSSPGNRNLVLAGQGDVDRDTHTDLLWQDPRTGDVVAWLMNGTTSVRSVAVRGTTLPPASVEGTRRQRSSPWLVAGVADLNGDGYSDLLWRHPQGGDLHVWFMNGTTATSGVALTPSRFADTRWQLRGVADFNGDGQADLLWHHQATGDLYVWLMNGTTAIGASYLNPSRFEDTRWQIGRVADFNGDGKPDLMWRHQKSGELYVWYMNGLKAESAGYPTPSRPSSPEWAIVP